MSTLCYIQRDGKYLMLHRTVKKHDVNKDKWIGVGGHFEADESPEECLLREVKEETGYTLRSWKFRGIVTFISGDGVTEYMHLFTSDDFTGTPIACDEGDLEWVDIDDVWGLNIWEGDKIFFRLIDEEIPFFSLKLIYDGHSNLVNARLNGRDMELLDIINEDGSKTGVVKERGVVHREGAMHETAHVWIMQQNDYGTFDVLLQLRSLDKETNPGCYDSSAAGHIPSGEKPDEAALRELDEEIGLFATPEDIVEIGSHHAEYNTVYFGKPYRDNELIHVYVYRGEVDISDLALRAGEVDAVEWMDFDECSEAVQFNTMQHCIDIKELYMVADYLKDFY